MARRRTDREGGASGLGDRDVVLEPLILVVFSSDGDEERGAISELTIRSNFRRFERISSCMPKFERLIQALRADFQKNVLKPPEESKK